MLNIFWVLRNLGYRDWGKGYKFNHCPTFWGFISDMGCLRELEKVLSFHFESWEKGMFLIKSVVVIRWGTVRIALILGRTKGCSSMNSGIDRSFPKQSLRSSKEAKGAGPAFGCLDLYDDPGKKNMMINYYQVMLITRSFLVNNELCIPKAFNVAPRAFCSLT